MANRRLKPLCEVLSNHLGARGSFKRGSVVGIGRELRSDERRLIVVTNKRLYEQALQRGPELHDAITVACLTRQRVDYFGLTFLDPHLLPDEIKDKWVRICGAKETVPRVRRERE